MSASDSTFDGYQPPHKKRKLLHSEADRGEQYKLPIQPGRVPLQKICWHPQNRGGQGIMPLHVHDVALNIRQTGTSKRRYGEVLLVQVPEKAKKSWLEGIRRKVAMSPLLSRSQAISHTEPSYATLTCTHFVEAHKVIRSRRQSTL